MNNEQEKIEKINYEQIENIVKNGLMTVMDNDYNYYKNNEIIVTTDIQYTKLKNKKPGCIYIVLSFSPASINFHQVVLPVIITVISEQNKVKVSKQLLTDFVYLYNQTKADDDKIFMLFNLPSVGTNFQPVYEGFRSILTVDGTFIISESASFFELTYNNEDIEEKVEFINGQLDYSAQTDTQPFYNMSNFTSSITKFSTLSFTITAFVVSDSDFIKDIIKVVLKKESNDKTFNFDVNFLNIENLNDNFKLINFSVNQKINDMPMFVATFTN
ncbi:MAG: hypothetical protein IKT40_03730 [Bacilli bacterium]|nr:hypothetical protein [Bacilli bacterium]